MTISSFRHGLIRIEQYKAMLCKKKKTNNKLNKFNSICFAVKRTMKNTTRREAKMKFYKVVALPMWLYVRETLIIKSKDINRFQGTEIR
jgi:hypothetical protein